MAKAKVLEDKVVISSTVLTDENLEKVTVLNPSVLNYKSEEGDILYQVAMSECNSFNRNGASFKGGKTHTNIKTDIEDAEARKNRVTAEITKTLLCINKIEEQVAAYLEESEDIDVDIDFIDED